MPIADDVQLGLANRFLVTVIPSTRSLGSWAKVEGLDVTWEVPDYRAGDAWNQRWFFPGTTKYTNVKLSRAANAKDTEEVKKWLDEVATKFTVGNMNEVLRRCKLYDYDAHAWLDFNGEVTAVPIDCSQGKPRPDSLCPRDRRRPRRALSGRGEVSGGSAG